MSLIAAQTALRWWRDMQPDPQGRRPGNRGALARLRRADVQEAMRQPETILLFRACGQTEPRQLPRIALTAAVLAQVRTDTGPSISVARMLGPDEPMKPETALMSPLRFRRIMEATSEAEELMLLRRMVALLGGAAPVADLAASILDWGEARRLRWTYDYWGAGRPLGAPSDTDKPTDPYAEDDAA